MKMLKGSALTFLVMISAIFTFSGCEVEIQETNSPFRVQTHLEDRNNGIQNAFQLPDGSIVVVSENTNGSATTFYKYDPDQILVDSITLETKLFSQPVVHADGSFYVLAQQVLFHISSEMELVRSREISFLFPGIFSVIAYADQITRLSNGNYILSITYEIVDPIRDKIVLVCVEDPFESTKALWLSNPGNFNGEWADRLKPASDGGFYITGHKHDNLENCFLIKYDADGNRAWKTTFGYAPSSLQMDEFPNSIMYSDLTGFYELDKQGVIREQYAYVERDLGRASNLLLHGNGYIYTMDVFNFDGLMLNIRKTDSRFNIEKSVVRGNSWTNFNIEPGRYLFRSGTDEYIALAAIENPGLTGTHWVFYKFDSELRQQGE